MILKNDIGIDLPKLENAPLQSNSFVKWLWFFTQGKRTLFFVASFMKIMFSVLELSQVYITGQIINGLVQGNSIQGMHASLFWVFVFIAVYTVYVGLLYMLKYTTIMRSYTEKRFSVFSLNHLFHLSSTFHENIETGGILQKIVQAKTAIRELLSIYFFNVLTFLGTMVTTAVILYKSNLSVEYYLCFVAYAIIYATYTIFMIYGLGKRSEIHSASTEKALSGVYEFLNHVRLVKTHCLANVFGKKSVDLEFDTHQKVLKLGMWRMWMWIGNCAIAVFFSSVILYMAVDDAINGVILVGTFAIIAQLTWAIWSYLEEIFRIFSDATEHKISFMRAVSLLKEAPEKVDIEPIQAAPDYNGINFENVSFSYEGYEYVPALKNVSLSLSKNEHIGLVGYSGSGKSTFVKLLMKMVLPSDGKILLDNSNLNHVKRDDYLSNVSFVPQDVDLFNDTVRENILVGKSMSDDDLLNVLKKAYADEFVERLPEGLDTIIGERGVKLSGGQRQRLGIARAIARNGDLVIFDEATSALDSVSENYIQESLKNSFEDKTMVVIAHRLATISHLDKIYVFDKGEIVEEGTHEQLITKNGKYAEMWNLQSDGFFEEGN